MEVNQAIPWSKSTYIINKICQSCWHVLKPETTKQNGRNETTETSETTETRETAETSETSETTETSETAETTETTETTETSKNKWKIKVKKYDLYLAPTISTCVTSWHHKFSPGL